MRREWNLRSGDVAGASAARREFCLHLETFAAEGQDADLEAAALIFGELVSNALKYGREPISVRVEPGPSHALLHVRDGGDCFELDNLRAADAVDVGGRGVSIAGALARSLLVRVLDSTCCVTAELPVRFAGDPIPPEKNRHAN